jgi:prevent-host-death family protein
MSVRDARTHFADVLYRAAAGRITYVTSRGRRIAAVVPLAVAEDAEDEAGSGGE